LEKLLKQVVRVITAGV